MNGVVALTAAAAPRSRWAAALVAVTLVRLVLAAVLPLSPDEAYYWVWSRALAPGFLDHPPMVALFIRAGTALAGETALGVRLLAPLAAAAGTLLLFDAGRRLYDRRTGLLAALLVNATPMFGVGAVLMTPDTPLLLFWTAALAAAARVATGGGGRWWLAVGLACGLALDSKYTAALLGAGLALWLLTPGMRAQLRTPFPWLGGALAGAAVLPVVAWNAAHGWASFAKQGGRTGDWHPEWRFLGELVAGQAGLATPWVFALMVAGVWAASRHWRAPAAGLLAASVLPGLLVFVQHAVGDRVQANWVAVLYPGAALAAARFAPRFAVPAASLGLALTALLYAEVSLHPVPLPGRADPTLRMAGFGTLAAEAAAAAPRCHAGFLAAEEYGTAALLAWAGTGLPVLAAAPRWALFDLPHAPPAGPGLLLLSDRRKEGPDPLAWTGATPAGMLTRRRGPTEIETFRLFCVAARPDAPAALLPRIHERTDPG